jgi:uncharacterized protein YcgI (DUF1989 family)
MPHQVEVDLNRQQREILQKLRDEHDADGSDADVVKSAFLGFVDSQLRPEGGSSSAASASDSGPAELTYGDRREDLKLEPVTGKALPVRKGEVLRIIQEADGGQCVDFNAFNIDDYKEHMDVGRTRLYNGIFPKEGGFLYSNSPRDRAMFEILHMPPTCKAETLGARCNAVLFERLFGFSLHTNCQDTLAASIGEYGLTPDDVHDSFNLWMNTDINSEGQMVLSENTGSKGEYVDLLAVFDTVSVPIVCGSGDVMTTSNFALKPIRVQVFEASDETLARATDAHERYNEFRNNRTPDDFQVSKVKADRSLQRDADYQPNWVNFPLDVKSVTVDLDDDEYESVEQARSRKLAPGKADGDIIRGCAMQHYLWMVTKDDPSVEFVGGESSN